MAQITTGIASARAQGHWDFAYQLEERQGQIQIDFREMYMAFTNAGISRRLVLQLLSQRAHDPAIASVISLLVAMLRYPWLRPIFSMLSGATGAPSGRTCHKCNSTEHVVKDCLLKKEEDDNNGKGKGGPTRNVFPHLSGGGVYGYPHYGK